MADFSTDLTSQLIASGLNPNNPTGTYTDFATQIAKNQEEQAAQEQAIARAKELTKQAQLETRQGLAAEKAGYNPSLINTMTPEQAVAYLRVILKEKGLTVSEEDITKWAASLPPVINASVVEAFANRFAKESTRAGQAALFKTTDKIDIPTGSTAKELGLVADKDNPEIGHVPDDGMYQVIYDNQGVIKRFIPGGKEPVDQSAKIALKESESTEKQWQKLDAAINGAFKTRSGGLGSLSTAVFRAVRAINTIVANDNLTAQDLANISQDISGIFAGGAATVVGAKDNDYRTAFTDFDNIFRQYTGVVGATKKLFGGNDTVLSQTKDKLLQVLVDLRDSAIANIKNFVESEEPAYKAIIEADPERWVALQDKKLKFIESGVLIPPGANTKLDITGIKHATETHKVKSGTTKEEAPTKDTTKGAAPKLNRLNLDL